MSAGGRPGWSGRVAPFEERYRSAIADRATGDALQAFGASWRSTRDRQIDEVESIAARHFDELSRELAEAKDRVRADLPAHVARFREAAESAGAVVHFERTIDDANATIGRLLRERGIDLLVKGKSMVSEELDLNEALAAQGIRCVETDLGEWLLQLAGERPSHLVMPAIHMRRARAAEVLGRAIGRELDPDDIPAMVRAAREGLREDFLAAGAGLTGANALVAESGTIMLVTNEGNGRLASSLPGLHVVTAGVDKLVPTMGDAMRLVRLLARSATGQPISTYTSFITGPAPGHELHIVLVDNGRSRMSADPHIADALRCVRCGACANVCPAYQVVGGRAFGHIYTGPIGLIGTAFHHGLEAAAGPQSLCLSCGACAEVCPVAIPLPEQILEVRQRVAAGVGLPIARRLALRAFASRRAFGAAVFVAALVARPFRRGRFTRAPWLPPPLARLVSWRTPPAIPLRPARARRELRDRTPAIGVTPATGRRVSLLLQCITDRLLPDVAVASARLLRAAGAEVEIPERQHCCGLPAFDAGDWDRAREMARQTIEAFEGAGDVVTPAPSCAAAIRLDYERLFEGEPEWLERARSLAGRVHDLASYLEGQGRLPDGILGGGERPSPAVHRFCQATNRLGAGDRGERLIRRLRGVEPRPLAEAAVCCGFGGQTSLVAPEMSASILERKLDHAAATGAEVLVTDNPGCILHLRGGADASGQEVQVLHLAEYLAMGLPPAPR